MIPKVLPDSNVLYSRTLKDWILLLSMEARMFTVHTTEDILAEVISSMRAKSVNLPGGVIHAFRESMMNSVDSVIQEYSMDFEYPGADQKDKHVWAAALSGEIQILVTNDAEMLSLRSDDLAFEILSPDEFLLLALDSSPAAVLSVALKQLDYWKGRSGVQVHEALKSAGCREFSDRLCELLADHLRR